MPRPVAKSVREEALLLIQELLKKGEDIPERYLALLRTDQGIKDFRSFIRRVNPDFQFLPHIEVIVKNLQKIADKELQRLIIMCPPRAGKSELCSRLFPAYLLFLRSKEEVGLASYSASLAESLSHSARQYYSLVGKVNPDVRARDNWQTSDGGGMWSAGITGSILGKGYHVGIIDDPHGSYQDITSDAKRNQTRERYKSVFRTRKNRFAGSGTALVVIAQRWSKEDLIGFILRESKGDEKNGIPPESWHVIALDAIKSDEPFDIPEHCTIEPDWRKAGEPLAPELMSLEELKREQYANSFFFASQYQQRPVSLEGELCSSDDFQFIEPDETPRFVRKIRAWDIALSRNKGDWTVGVLLGITDNRGDTGSFDVCVLDVIRERIEGPDVYDLIRRTAAADGSGVVCAVEMAGAQRSLVQSLRREAVFNEVTLVEVPIHGRSGDLKMRALPVFSKLNLRQFHLVRGRAWNDTLIREFTSFSGSSSDVDDIISAVSIGYTVATMKRYMGVVAPEELLPEYGTWAYYDKLCGLDLSEFYE